MLGMHCQKVLGIPESLYLCPFTSHTQDADICHASSESVGVHDMLIPSPSAISSVAPGTSTRKLHCLSGGSFDI